MRAEKSGRIFRGIQNAVNIHFDVFIENRGLEDAGFKDTLFRVRSVVGDTERNSRISDLHREANGITDDRINGENHKLGSRNDSFVDDRSANANVGFDNIAKGENAGERAVKRSDRTSDVNAGACVVFLVVGKGHAFDAATESAESGLAPFGIEIGAGSDFGFVRIVFAASDGVGGVCFCHIVKYAEFEIVGGNAVFDCLGNVGCVTACKLTDCADRLAAFDLFACHCFSAGLDLSGARSGGSGFKCAGCGGSRSVFRNRNLGLVVLGFSGAAFGFSAGVVHNDLSKELCRPLPEN